MTQIAIPVSEAHEACGCTARTIRTAINRGELIARRLGLQTVLLTDELSAWAKAKPPAHRRNKTKTEVTP
jgi:hypothetical protein